MASDPIEQEARGSRDLYDVATWERRTWFDAIAAWVYALAVKTGRAFVVLLATFFLAVQFVLGGLGAIADPIVGVLVILSVVPALAIAAYVWSADVTTGEPLSLLVTTFVLAVLFATFAAVINSLLRPSFAAIPVVGIVLFFFVVVGPVEEGVKVLAIRLHAYRSARFGAVIDGAVYGAAAGLGFATIENAFYITQAIDGPLGGLEAIGAAGGTAVARALAGPGHVLYSAIAGYYLGLAKFNREHAGPIVVKGLLVAALLHATYNTLVSVVPQLLVAASPLVTPLLAVVGFVLVYDGLVAYYLYRKISTYRNTYREVGVTRGRDERAISPEVTEFEP